MANHYCTYGYARVSSHDQNLDRQISLFLDYGVSYELIYSDYKSGKDFDRPQYKKLLSKLNEGDLLLITSIDRLGRNYVEITEQWKLITKDIKANIYVIDMPLLDMRNKNDLTGTFIADLVLQILSYVANIERLHIRERQEQGIRIAKEKGVRFGRPSAPIPNTFYEIAKEYRAGNITINEALIRSNMSKSTYYRKLKQLNI